jgi:hypothetical protein
MEAHLLMMLFFGRQFQMSEINRFGETISKMPEPALFTVVALAAFALAAFTIYIVVNHGSRPRR